MFNRIRLMMACGSIGLMGLGGRGVWTAMANPKPVETTCEAFDAHVIRAKWVRLTDCRVSLPKAVNFYQPSDSTAADEIFIPLYAAGDMAMRNTRVVLATRDTALLSLYNQLGAIGDHDQAVGFASAHMREMEQVRTVEGLVRYGAGMGDDERGKLSEFLSSPEFAVLDEGEEPTLLGGFATIGGGVMLGLLTAASFGMRGRRRG